MSTTVWSSIIIGTISDNIIKRVKGTDIETRYNMRTGESYNHEINVTKLFINGQEYTNENIEELLSNHDLELINEKYNDERFIGITLAITDGEIEIDRRTDFSFIRKKVIENIKKLHPNLDVSQVKMYLVLHQS